MLETIGYDAAVAASFAPWRAADAAVGRVLRADRGVVTVLTEAGVDRITLGGALLAEIAEHPDGTPCVGDWVVVRAWPDGPHTLERVLPRRGLVIGPAAEERTPVRAANVDVLALLPGADLPGAVTQGERTALPDDVEVLLAGSEAAGEDPDGVGVIRARLDSHRTVALLGPPPAVGAVLDRLLGSAAIGGRQPGSELVLLPGGGAVVALEALSPAPSRWSPPAARPVS